MFHSSYIIIFIIVIFARFSFYFILLYRLWVCVWVHIKCLHQINFRDTDQGGISDNFFYSLVLFFFFLLRLQVMHGQYISDKFFRDPDSFLYSLHEQTLSMHHWETSIHYFMLKYVKLENIEQERIFLTYPHTHTQKKGIRKASKFIIGVYGRVCEYKTKGNGTFCLRLWNFIYKFLFFSRLPCHSTRHF